MTQLPAVAKKVFVLCKKCDVDRYQVVLSHSSLTSARLECEVCKTKNVFTLESTTRSGRSAVAKKKTRLSEKAAAEQNKTKWVELCGTQDGQPSPYTMKAQFETGCSLNHPKFGLGFVIASTGQSIQVLFEDGERSLVHNRN